MIKATAKRGFTLVELVLSLTIMSILMLGLGSAVLIATKAMPDGTGIGQTQANAAQAADDLAEELRSALWIREHTATSVAFTIPDRTGDGAPERIRYAWSGTAGAPLTRQYNGGSVVNVVDEVNDLDLDYFVETRSETIAGAPIESAEMVLQNSTNRLYAMDYTIKEKEWYGQVVNPSLPADAVVWKITRVQFRARYRGSTNGIMAIQIRPVPDGGNTPSTTVLEEVPLAESSLGSSYGWKEIAYSNLRELVPGSKYCLLVACQKNDASLGDVEYDYWSGFWSLSTTNAGSSWTYASGNGMYHYIYGTYSTPGTPLTVTRSYITGIRIALQPTSEAASRVATSTQTVNTPELLAGWWETGFDTNPTLDDNGDGVADWTAESGTFDVSGIIAKASTKAAIALQSLLDSKLWKVNTALATNPDMAFTTLTTITARFQASKTGGTGAALQAKVDRGSGLCGVIVARLTLQSDSTQTLQVGYKSDDATTVVIKTITGLPNDLVELRLVTEPGTDTCNIKADGVDYGSIRYYRYAPASTTCGVSILATDGGPLFDYVSVRASE